MTLQEFAPIFAMLAVQLRATDADEATVRSYHVALEDLEPEFVAMAATAMAKRGGALDGNPHWFPKTSEWRDHAEQAERDRTAQLEHRLKALHKAGHELCAACRDTGWAPGDDGRVRRCDCRELRRLEVLGRRPLPMLTDGSAA